MVLFPLLCTFSSLSLLISPFHAPSCPVFLSVPYPHFPSYSFDRTIAWFVVGIRLLHSTRRVSCGFCWFTHLVELPNVQDVLLSFWRDAGKWLQLVVTLCLSKYIVQFVTPCTENLNLPNIISTVVHLKVLETGHLRVPLCLCFKASLSVKPFL